MGVFKEIKATLLIWIGFIVFGAFELIYGVIQLHYVDKWVWGNTGSLSDYYNLIYVGFFFSGIAKVIGFFPKLNNIKLLALINMIVHGVMVFFGIVGMAGISNETPGFDNMTDKAKAQLMSDGVLLFGSSIGFTIFFLGLYCNIKKSD